MKTRFFKFPSAEVSFAQAQEAGLTHKDEHNEDILTRFTDQYALDVIGEMYAPTGNMIEGEDGRFFPEQAPLDGWHVNARILSGDPLPESFAQYEIFPNSPSRDFA